MDTKMYRTKQEFAREINPKGKKYIIGLDIGYSSVKCFYEKGHFVFPSYAKKITTGMMNIADKKDILYKAEGSNDVYMIGYNAQTMVDSDDTNDTDGELFSRNRYRNERFKIICAAALGLAVNGNTDNKEIFIQTGLPSSYVEGDSGKLKKTLSETFAFSLKVGSENWKKYNIRIKPDNIHIIPQPSASLYSAIIKSDGKYTDNAKAMLSDNVLVMDAGFGTFDFFGIMNREIKCKDSTDELGMRRVLASTAKSIQEDTGESINVTALQNCLESGYFVYTNEEDMTSEERSLSPYLQKANKEVLNMAFAKAKSVTNTFRGYHYIIITGGTGQAWLDDIRAWLKNMKSIKVIPANINDHLPLLYANARGYYLFGYITNK